jgi:hypothetical protein
VKCSLIDRYEKKKSGQGTSTFNRSSVNSNFLKFVMEQVAHQAT